MLRMSIAAIALVSCGRFGFDAVAETDGALASDAASEVEASDAEPTADAALPAIVSVTGAVVVDPPDSVVQGALEHDLSATLFPESGPHTLDEVLTVNLRGPGDFTGFASDHSNPIDAGTKLVSYFLHADKVGSSTEDIEFVVSLEFRHKVLGLITSDELHLVTDATFGSRSTIYPLGGRTPEDGDDFITISRDSKTVTLSLGVNTSLDQVRIFVAVP